MLAQQVGGMEQAENVLAQMLGEEEDEAEDEEEDEGGGRCHTQ
jgi:hypothetical protein